MASLTLRNGQHALTHELVGDIIAIGRAPLNDIVIESPEVSARHAALLKVGDSYWLKDLDSTNGTHINGVLFNYGALNDGDTIRFGAAVAIFAEPCRKRWSTRAIRRFWTSSTTRRNVAPIPKGDTTKIEVDDSSKEQVRRVDQVWLPHRMTHKIAIQEAMKTCSARKKIGEHLLAWLDKEIDTCDQPTHESALNFWRNRVRNMRDH